MVFFFSKEERGEEHARFKFDCNAAPYRRICIRTMNRARANVSYTHDDIETSVLKWKAETHIVTRGMIYRPANDIRGTVEKKKKEKEKRKKGEREKKKKGTRLND